MRHVGVVSSTIYAFVKIFENEKHAQDFVAGKLFMNTLRYFKEYRDAAGELRGDPFEGVVAWLQPSMVKVEFGGRQLSSSDIAYPIAIHDDQLLDRNAFCIYSLNSRGHDSVSRETILDFKRTLEIHESCYGLGGYCVVILNAQEFINRASDAIRKSNLSGTLALVDYFNENEHHGEFNTQKHGYHKRSFFSHQREYRVLVNTYQDNSGPYILHIGDLSDIALLTTPEEFNSELEIRLPDGSAA